MEGVNEVWMVDGALSYYYHATDRHIFHDYLTPMHYKGARLWLTV